MSEIRPIFIGDDSDNYRGDHVFFANHNLDSEILKSALAPIIKMICNRIESTYKSPSKISFVKASCFMKTKLLDFLQFDDVCIRLLHVESGLDVFVTLGARIARTLLIRLLATSLIDDSQGLLFSSTEKGIFSFIIARLLFDLKNMIEKMPNLKLLGVYHCQDEALNGADIEGFGVYNFTLSFAADTYPIMIAVPPNIFKMSRDTTFDSTNLIARCGHLSWPIIFRLKTLNCNMATINNMSFGDLVIFDHSDQYIDGNALCGPIRALWHNLVISGRLDAHHGAYRFFLSPDDLLNRMEDSKMEEVEIAGSSNRQAFAPEAKNENTKLAGLAKNIRVPLSIELSRVPMTLKELCEIKEGEIIDLHRKIDDPLEMVVEGKVIGHCHPVQIDGRLGIRVLNIDSEDKKSHS